MSVSLRKNNMMLIMYHNRDMALLPALTGALGSASLFQSDTRAAGYLYELNMIEWKVTGNSDLCDLNDYVDYTGCIKRFNLPLNCRSI